jgi:hypothetical protein
MIKDLIGKYCLVYMTPSKTEFRPEISVITGVSKNYPDSYVTLDNDVNGGYHIRSLLSSDNKKTLEEVLKVQEVYLKELSDLRNKIHNLKKEHSVVMSKMVKEIKA